jgi:nuclear transport factor 2 (NTF2) superfamily protein
MSKKNKILYLHVKKEPTVTYKYSYTYKDNKGVVVRAHGFDNLEELEKNFKNKFKKLSNDKYKIIEEEIKSNIAK